MSNTISQFVCKLLEMIENHQSMISWNHDGTEFSISNHKEFAEKVLPNYFRQIKFQSFIRQLNMYSFHKVCRRNNSISFRNQYFIRGKKELYHLIKRRSGKPQQEKGLSFHQQIQKTKILLSQCKEVDQFTRQTILRLLQFRNRSIEDVKKIKTKIQFFKKQIGQKLCRDYKNQFSEIKSGFSEMDTHMKTIDKRINDILDPQDQEEINDQDLKTSLNTKNLNTICFIQKNKLQNQFQQFSQEKQIDNKNYLSQNKEIHETSIKSIPDQQFNYISYHEQNRISFNENLEEEVQRNYGNCCTFPKLQSQIEFKGIPGYHSYNSISKYFQLD